jgi:hypothetical protein
MGHLSTEHRHGQVVSSVLPVSGRISNFGLLSDFGPSAFGFFFGPSDFSSVTCELTCKKGRILLLPMRILLAALGLSALACAGCASHKGGSAGFSEIPARPSASVFRDQVTLTPETVLIGKVARVNQDGRFAVMTFPIGHLPLLNQRLNVYRQGLKVGEIRVTGPQLDDNVVGDISAGEAQATDEVRGQ